MKTGSLNRATLGQSSKGLKKVVEVCFDRALFLYLALFHLIEQSDTRLSEGEENIQSSSL
jgi:hypothetical protein